MRETTKKDQFIGWLSVSLLSLFLLLLLVPSVYAFNTTGIEFFYNFDDDYISGSTAIDYTNQINATIGTSVLTGQTGFILEAFNNAGAGKQGSAYGKLASNVNGYTEFSWGGWIYIDTLSGNIVTQVSGGGSFMRFGRNTGTNALNWEGNSGPTGFTSNYTLTTGVWTHILITAKENGVVTMYVNGSIVYNASQAGWAGANDDFYIGGWESAGSTPTFDYDNWFWFNRQLSFEEVQDIIEKEEEGTTYPWADVVQNDNYLTHETFDQEFTSTVTIGTAFTEIGSVTYTVEAPTTLSYYNAEITTLGTQGTTTATCRLLDDNQEYARQSRTINNNEYGNFFISTPSINLSVGQHNLTVECLRTVGGKYDVVGNTLVGHLLYDDNTNTTIGYQNNITNVTIPAVHNNFYNITYTTGTNYNTSTTNNLFLWLDWRASPTYTTAGNISTQWKIHNTWCMPKTRTGGAGTTGSITGSCYAPNLLPSTTYTLELWGNATNSVLNDLKTHIVELVQANGTIDNTSISEEPLNTTIPRSLAETVTNSIIGGTFELFSKATVQITNDGTTSSDASFYLSETTDTRTSNRTKDADGSVGNLGIEGAWIVSGTDNKTVSLYGGTTNNNSRIVTGEIITYVTSAPTFSSNTFEVYAHNYYNGSTIQDFNVSIGGSIFQSSDGVATVVSTDTTVDFNVSAEGYFYNGTIGHDRTTNYNATLVRWTQIRAFYQGSLINNHTATINNTDTGFSQQSITEDGSTFLEMEKNNTFNLTLSNINNNGVFYAETFLNQEVTEYIEMINVTVLLSNTFNLSFLDEITEQPINETVTLELITSDSATNISINSSQTGEYNLSLLSPGEYTLRFRSASYTERDYIVTLNNNTFKNLQLYMITISSSSDLLATVEDTSGEAVENATITLLRYYASCNCYNIVEMDRTSSAGQSLFWIQAFEGHYKWSINYLGENKFLSTSPENIVTDTRFFTIDTGKDYYESYTRLGSIARSVIYNASSGVLTYTWSDPNNIVTSGCLVTERVNGTRTQTEENCNNGATGSVILELDNTTRYRYYATITTNTDFSDHTLLSGWIDNFSNFLDNYSDLGAFLGASVLMGLSLLFSFSAIAVLIINAVGMLLLGFMGLTKITTTFIVGFMALAVGFGAFLMRR